MAGVLLYALVCSQTPDPATGVVPQFPAPAARAALLAAPEWVRAEAVAFAARAGTHFPAAEAVRTDDDEWWEGACNVIRGRAIGSLLPWPGDPRGPRFNGP